jgi:hypothetical protein
MSVQKKSLISSRPTEKKATTKPVKETALGDSKGLTASALRWHPLKYKALGMQKALKPSFAHKAFKR